MSKGYNNEREAVERLYKNTKTNRKKFKDIFKELGARHITLEDIAEGNKPMGFDEVCKDHDVTYDEMMGMKAYSKAITEGSIRHMEFIRDTVGEKPANNIDITSHESPLEGLSTEELRELLGVIKDIKDENNE